jgi:hypothetical protein
METEVVPQVRHSLSAPLHVSGARSQSLPVVETEPTVLPSDLAVVFPERVRVVEVVGETTDGVQVAVPLAEAKSSMADGRTLLAVGGGDHAKDAPGSCRVVGRCVES